MSSIHLPFIMALNTSDCLVKAISPTVLMIWMTKSMFMKYDASTLGRVLCAMQIPVMPSIWLMALKKRQAHNLFRSHDLTLIVAGILLQKKMDSAARVFLFSRSLCPL